MWRRTGQYQQMHESNRACISAARVKGTWMFSGWLRDDKGRWQCDSMDNDATSLKEALLARIEA